MKWIDVDDDLPEIIETETHDDCTIEYSDYVVIFRVILWLTSYHVARLKRVKFNDGKTEETWECSTGDNIFSAMTVYYWSEITPVEIDSEQKARFTIITNSENKVKKIIDNKYNKVYRAFIYDSKMHIYIQTNDYTLNDIIKLAESKKIILR